MWIHFIVLVLSVVSLIFLVIYFYRVYYLYSLYQSKMKQKEEKDIRTIDLIYSFIEEKNDENTSQSAKAASPVRRTHISSRDKTRLLTALRSTILRVAHEQQPDTQHQWVNYWNAISIVGNLFQMVGAFVFLTDIGGKAMVPTTFIGPGCFCSWFITARYLEMIPELYEMFLAIFKALPAVMYFIISVTPIFFGCGMLLCCIFWGVEYFTNLNKSFFSQVGLFLGDLVLDTTEFLPIVSYFWANVYIYGFILMFMFFAHTILLGIISKTFTKDVSTDFKKAKEEVMSPEQRKQGMTEDFRVYGVQLRNTLAYFEHVVRKSNDPGAVHEYKQFLNNVLDELNAP